MTTTFLDLEAAWADARRAFGAWYLGTTLGSPVDGDPGTLGEREQRYREARTRLGTALDTLDETALDDEEHRGLLAVRSNLASMDETGPEGAAGLEVEDTVAATEDPAVARLRRDTLDAYAAAAADLRLGDEHFDRLTGFAREATDPDRDRRRARFLAQAPMWAAVDGDGGPDSPYRRLLRSSAARWARDGSPIDAAARAVGLDPAGFEAAIRLALERFRAGAHLGDLEPWDYRWATSPASRHLDRLIPADRLRAINDAHLRSLGADPAQLGIRYDVEPREGRPPVPVAFSMALDIVGRRPDGTWHPVTPWVVATYAEGGLGNLNELLHESGHAIHSAAIRERPALFEPPTEDGGLIEGIADVVGWDTHEPAFVRHHLGGDVSTRELLLDRHGAVMLDLCWTLFEIELHRDPDRRPNDAWADIAGRSLGIRPHPEWSWWAVRGQLIEAPGYMANYAIAVIVAAAVRARMRELRGDWLAEGGDPGWYEMISDGLLRFGAAKPADRALGDFLGGPLTPQAFIADVARLGAP